MSGAALSRDRAAVVLDDPPRYIEPQPGAADAAAYRIATRERLEKLFQILGGNPDPLITDDDFRLIVLSGDADEDLASIR